MKNLALVISKVLNPLSTSLLAVVAVVLVQQIPDTEKVLWIFLGLGLTIVPSFILYLQYKKGVIVSLWSPSAKERQLSYIFWTVFSIIFSAVAFWLLAPRSILALGLVFLVLGFINLSLTTSFKISIHSEMVTLWAIVSVLSVSVELIFLVLLIPLVGWARLYLKHHTLSEITYGALVSILVVYFVFSFFGLATF